MEEHMKSNVFNISGKSNMIGYYLDEKIWEIIELEDGRVFEYESIAVERYPGVYSTNDPESTYILVHPGLLYREVD